MLEYTEAQKECNRFRCVKPANAIIAHADFLNLNRNKSWWISYQIHFAFASETTSRHLSELLSAGFSLLCVCVRAGDSRQSSGSYDFCRGLKSIDCSFDWSGIQIVLFLYTKGVRDKYRLQKLAGEPRTQLPNVNKVSNQNCWLMITAPEHIAVTTAVLQKPADPLFSISASFQRCYSHGRQPMAPSLAWCVPGLPRLIGLTFSFWILECWLTSVETLDWESPLHLFTCRTRERRHDSITEPLQEHTVCLRADTSTNRCTHSNRHLHELLYQPLLYTC